MTSTEFIKLARIDNRKLIVARKHLAKTFYGEKFCHAILRGSLASSMAQ
jgi:hypothetical protein